MKNVFLALVLAALTACGSEEKVENKDVLMHNDFDSLAGWLPDAGALAREQAHSGQYSLKVDQGREFSLGYNTLLGQLSSTRIRGVRVDAWAFLPDQNAKARLGFIVKAEANGKELLADGLDLQDQVKDYGKWLKISKEFTFPAAATYNSQLVMFLWGPGLSGPVYLDDVQLTALR